MVRLRILRLVLAIGAVTVVCALANSQTGRNISALQPSHERKVTSRPMLFLLDSETQEQLASLEFLPYERMTRQDRDLEADAESSISQKAGFAGLEFNQGKWNYQEVVCLALPNHLFLQFTRNNGTGDVSVFSASIPRSGDGRVRIIPILRRGYSLFSPAPINALTISAFNHIRAEKHPVKAPDWLGTGLCYAALAGAKPEIGHPEETDLHKMPSAPTAKLVIPLRASAIIQFTDVSTAPRDMEWTMTFDGKGRLLKATHSRAPQVRTKIADCAPVKVEEKPVRPVVLTEKTVLIR
jgi:hypothetical protein